MQPPYIPAFIMHSTKQDSNTFDWKKCVLDEVLIYRGNQRLPWFHISESICLGRVSCEGIVFTSLAIIHRRDTLSLRV